MNARNIVYGAIPAALVGSILAVVASQTGPKTAEAQVVNGIEVRATEERGAHVYTLVDENKRTIAYDLDGNGVDLVNRNDLGLTRADINAYIAMANSFNRE